MDSKENVIVIKLSDGQDVVKEVLRVAGEQNIDYGFFLAAAGKVKNFELITHGTKGSIESQKHAAPHEVNAISGKIQRAKEGIQAKINVSLTQTGFTPKSGQMTSGQAAGELEIAIRRVDLKKIIIA